MNVALRLSPMTRHDFLAWVQQQESRYEFDGREIVDVNGGTVGHAMICSNTVFSLRTRLRGSMFRVLPEAGVATGEAAVRYPDVLVTEAVLAHDALLVDAPVLVIEVLSPSSGKRDRIDKAREYQAVPTIRRYIILESTGPGATVFERSPSGPWVTTILTATDTLELPELGIAIPLIDFYEDVSF